MNYSQSAVGSGATAGNDSVTDRFKSYLDSVDDEKRNVAIGRFGFIAKLMVDDVKELKKADTRKFQTRYEEIVKKFKDRQVKQLSDLYSRLSTSQDKTISKPEESLSDAPDGFSDKLPENLIKIGDSMRPDSDSEYKYNEERGVVRFLEASCCTGARMMTSEGGGVHTKSNRRIIFDVGFVKRKINQGIEKDDIYTLRLMERPDILSNCLEAVAEALFEMINSNIRDIPDEISVFCINLTVVSGYKPSRTLLARKLGGVKASCFEFDVRENEQFLKISSECDAPFFKISFKDVDSLMKYTGTSVGGDELSCVSMPQHGISVELTKPDTISEDNREKCVGLIKNMLVAIRNNGVIEKEVKEVRKTLVSTQNFDHTGLIQ